ncbi:MAG TPA: MBOAT family protein, partial [Candidatus Intestinimonas pullistercoris]|nr:MBOAT family protein [Candidatus Intestinimonas pullistercoris]
MVFSSLLFLFLYLPLVLGVYYLTPLRWRNAFLLVVNLIFYGWGEPTYIVLMVFTILVDYFAGALVGRWKGQGKDLQARWAVGLSLALNLAI